MNDEGPRIADIGEMREEPQFAHERDAGLIAAGETEGEDGTGALGAIALGEFMIAVAGEPRIAHPFHRGMLAQMFGDRLRIVAMALHAQAQSLDAGEDQK